MDRSALYLGFDTTVEFGLLLPGAGRDGLNPDCWSGVESLAAASPLAAANLAA